MEAVRGGSSRRSAARSAGVPLSTVQYWLTRAGGLPLDEVDWASRPPVAVRVARTPPGVEDLVLDMRQALRALSVLGEYGPVAIRRALAELAEPPVPLPAVRTIARILERRGALDSARRVRRPAPPPGWYLPDVRRRELELDSFDVISGLRLLGGIDVDILTGISLHGGLTAAWPAAGVTARSTVDAIAEHWRAVGRPGYAQFDNDTRFIGGHSYPNSIGPVIRFCLAAGVVPVFAPPLEVGFQASIEAFNGLWQRKLWARFWTPDLESLTARSEAYIAASRQRSRVRIEAAPDRAVLGLAGIPDLTAAPSGRIVFIRRTSAHGTASILKRLYPVDPRWVNRLVRGELDLDARRVRFYALRRREPDDQPLLGDAAFEPPARWFR